MKKIFLTTSILFFIYACGGGGYGSNSSYGGGSGSPGYTGPGPAGDISSQLDPVQSN